VVPKKGQIEEVEDDYDQQQAYQDMIRKRYKNKDKPGEKKFDSYLVD